MTTEHNGPMRVEVEIDAALKMLGETQPPAAIVSRVHRGLETAAMSRRARSCRRLLIPAAGVAIAALALVAIFIQTQRRPETQESALKIARVVTNTPSAQATTMPPSATFETERAHEGKRLVHYPTRRRGRQGSETRHAKSLLSYPLTRQEKLLLKFVQTAKPADLQALNPEYQAKVEAQQDAEFAAYLKSGSSPERDSATQTMESTQE